MRQIVSLLVSLILTGCASAGVSSAVFTPNTSTRLTSNVKTRLRPHTPTFTTAYKFAGGNGGIQPDGSVVVFKNALYGTTRWGGGDASCVPSEPSLDGCGIVYALSNGTLQILHTFTGGSDGSLPNGLILFDGMLYGTTYEGGTANAGTIFVVDPATGSERVLYSFTGHADGSYPMAGVVYFQGSLYGTTSDGGAPHCPCGTVFKFDLAAGTLQTIWSFKGGHANPPDGAVPKAPLLPNGGRLYGTTSRGGTWDRGAIFAVTPKGAEQLLYSFTGNTDGVDPVAALVAVNGDMYGTTAFGGALPGRGYCSYNSSNVDSGCGTIFAYNPENGRERVLHRFGATGDGAEPISGLVPVGSVLYGTTEGSEGGCCGTIFSFNLSNNTESVAHNFSNSDGAAPTALTVSVETLDGTALFGGQGCGSDGCGTVFSLRPIAP